MRIFLPNLTQDTDVENAVRLLRKAEIFIGSGAIVRENRQTSYGSITVRHHDQVPLALEVLAQAGIKASN